jgi:8-oxo-dGTP pyrophosphatase MutT (NUDIX family)
MKLNDLIKSKTREKILCFFFKNKEKKYYLRELERILGLPVGNIRRELISLERSGLFKKEKVGNLTYYFLNISSPFFEAVESIISKTSKTDKKLKKDLKKRKGEQLVVLRKRELDLLSSKISELDNILETLSIKESEVEDFINLAVVINEKKEVLLIKRVQKEKGKDGAVLTWAFPGGKQRLNESKERCVIREVLAETGYEIKPIMEISSRFHPQFPVFIVYHLCKLVFPDPIAKPKEPHEIGEIRWVKPKEVSKLFTTDIDPKVKEELKLK